MSRPMNTLSAVDPVTIARADAFKLRLPLRKPVLMAGVRLEASDTFVVRIESTRGVVGWGEANAAPSHGGASLDDMGVAFETGMAHRLRGEDALQLSAISRRLEEGLERGFSAASAVDMALHDLVGNALGVPAHVLLGGRRRDAVSALWLVGTGNTEGDLAEGRRLVDEGYHFFKLKVGVRPVQEEIDLAIALRKAVGNEVRFCADANMGMDADQAIAYAQGVRAARLDFLEQPLRKDDREGLRRLVATQALDIGLDESVVSVQHIIDHVPDGIRGVSLKTLKLGGMSGVVAVAHVCAALGLKLNLAGKIAETGIASAALLHLAAVVPTVEWGVSPSHLFLAEDIVLDPPQPRQGRYTIPNAPGLGVTVDMQKLERWCVH
jgi:L-alanine-DL-glutamate epimerase-like enolase superfamily enzyme